MELILYSKWIHWGLSNQEFSFSFQSKEKPNQNHYIFYILSNRNFPFYSFSSPNPASSTVFKTPTKKVRLLNSEVKSLQRIFYIKAKHHILLKQHECLQGKMENVNHWKPWIPNKSLASWLGFQRWTEGKQKSSRVQQRWKESVHCIGCVTRSVSDLCAPCWGKEFTRMQGSGRC